jgi:steroid delta-isomerase-like uncharacterized protein
MDNQRPSAADFSEIAPNFCKAPPNMAANTDLLDRAQRYMQVWSAGGDGLLDELAHSQLVVDYTHFDAPFEGIAAYREMLQTTDTFFPDLTVHITETAGCDAQVTLKWYYTGSLQAGELFGVQANGQAVEVPGMTLLTFEDGLVRREAGVVDNLTLLMQLGALGG